MGRTKVDPEKRQRALQACQPCHVMKKRCDCKSPCSNCIKRQETASCTYSPDLPRIPGKPRKKSSSVDEATAESSSDGSPTAVSRMLWSSKGSRVYVGDSASLSFLHILRDILTRYMGPSAFTDDVRRGFMLETERNMAEWLSLDCNHSFEEARELADYFLAATSGVLDVFTRDTIQRNLRFEQATEEIKKALNHAILAIGAQCRANGSEDNRCERVHLAHAQTAAFQEMLEAPSADLIRLFLLLAFYMLGACRRNSAYMYVGVAVRAACALGFHHEEAYRAIDLEEQISRHKTWKSLRILDLLIGSILGRPTMTSNLDHCSEMKRPSESPAEAHRSLSLKSTCEVWSIADETVMKLYQKSGADVAAAKSFISRLEKWSSGLSPSLRSYNPSGIPLRDQETVIGNMHVSCSYYFTVMLVTRRFLISDLMAQLGRTDADATPKAAGGQELSEVGRLAHACTEAAKLMLRTCQDLLRAGMLLNNMCLLKAWVFAAGLILGFSMFALGNIDYDFDSATNVLQVLARNSPQAQLYYDILVRFKQAIQQHQEQTRGNFNERAETYVEKIFSLDSHPSTAEVREYIPEDGFAAPIAEGLPNLDFNAGSVETETLSPPSLEYSAMTGGMPIGDFDSVAAQLWDDFIFSQDFTNNMV